LFFFFCFEMDEVHFQILIKQLFFNMLNYNLIIPDYLYTSSPAHSRKNKICVIVINNNNLTIFVCVWNGIFDC